MSPLQRLPEEILLCIFALHPLVSAAIVKPLPRGAEALPSSSPPYPTAQTLESNTSQRLSSPSHGFHYAPSACPQITSDYGYTPLYLPATGSGQSYAAACNSQTNSYSVASYSWITGIKAPYSTVVSEYTSGINLGTGSAPYTTLCDGFPRAHGTPTLTGSSSFVITVSTPILSQYATPPILPQCLTGSGRPTFPFPSPSCSIGNADCVSLYKSFAATATEAYEIEYATNAPNCRPSGPAWSSVLADTPREQCQIQGNNVKLYYWPDIVEGGEDCPGTGNTITPAPQETKTAVVDGTTVTSPTVFLSLDYFVATFANALDNPIHPYPPSVLNFTDIKLALHSSSLSSFVSYLPGQPWQKALSTAFSLTSTALPTVVFKQSAEPYNVANLDGPVPASAYFMGKPGGLSLLGSSPYLNTIFDDYHPILSAPQQLRDIDSRLSACSFDIGGLYDPPQALSPAAYFVTPTITPLSPVQTPAAAPGQSPADQPAPTATSSKSPQKGVAGHDGSGSPNVGSSPGTSDNPSSQQGEPAPAGQTPFTGVPSTASATSDPPPSAADPASSSSDAASGSDPPAAGGSLPRTLVLGTATLTAGGPAITLGPATNANRVVLDSAGNLVIDGTRTVPATDGPVTIGGSVWTVGPTGAPGGSDGGAGSASEATSAGSKDAGSDGMPTGTDDAGGSGMPTPTGDASGSGTQTPADGANGSGTQTPADGASGSGTQAPAGGANGSGAQAPAGGASGSGAQAPAGGASGSGMQAPTGDASGAATQMQTATATATGSGPAASAGAPAAGASSEAAGAGAGASSGAPPSSAGSGGAAAASTDASAAATASAASSATETGTDAGAKTPLAAQSMAGASAGRSAATSLQPSGLLLWLACGVAVARQLHGLT